MNRFMKKIALLLLLQLYFDFFNFVNKMLLGIKLYLILKENGKFQITYSCHALAHLCLNNKVYIMISLTL